MNRAEIGGRALEYEVRGAGEPVVLVHGSHIADAFAFAPPLNQSTGDWYTHAAIFVCCSAAVFSTASVTAGS
jgi:hypothetical protein